MAFLPPPGTLPVPLPSSASVNGTLDAQASVTRDGNGGGGNNGNGGNGIVVKWLELVSKEENNNETSTVSPPPAALADQPTISPPTSPDQPPSTPSSSFTNHLTHDNGQLNPEDFYIARVGWWPDGSIMIQTQNRRQTVLQLLRIDPYTGQREVM